MEQHKPTAQSRELIAKSYLYSSGTKPLEMTWLHVGSLCHLMHGLANTNNPSVF